MKGCLMKGCLIKGCSMRKCLLIYLKKGYLVKGCLMKGCLMKGCLMKLYNIGVSIQALSEGRILYTWSPIPATPGDNVYMVRNPSNPAQNKQTS